MLRPQILLFGDSITQVSFTVGGWGACLANSYVRKADILNRGYAGYNTTWALIMLQHLYPLDIPNPPQPPIAATIFLGANDAALPGKARKDIHVPLDQYKENLRKIIQHLKKFYPPIQILMITPPPIDEVLRREHKRDQDKPEDLPERTNEVTGQYAKTCVALAKELGLPSVNLWSKFQETKGWGRKFLKDGLHLTPEGNAIVYQEVLKAFNETSVSPLKLPNYDGVSKILGFDKPPVQQPSPAPAA